MNERREARWTTKQQVKLEKRHKDIRREYEYREAKIRKKRDASEKALYARLFLSLVGQINMAICPAEGKWLSLGVLDIYGFEIFEASAASTVGLVRLGSLGSQYPDVRFIHLCNHPSL